MGRGHTRQGARGGHGGQAHTQCIPHKHERRVVQTQKKQGSLIKKYKKCMEKRNKLLTLHP